MGLTTKKLDIFGKKLPAWIFVAALVVVGAGAAAGLVLKDQVNGTTTIAVSQAIRVAAPIHDPNSDADEFLGTVDDDGISWAAHFEANNGDMVIFKMEVRNYAGNDDATVCLLTIDIPDGMTVDVTELSGDDGHSAVRINYNQWKFAVDGKNAPNDYGTNWLCVEIALEDALSTGFFELQGSIIPLNV